jgi:dolichol-phosphate mannosyltransferase
MRSADRGAHRARLKFEGPTGAPEAMGLHPRHKAARSGLSGAGGPALPHAATTPGPGLTIVVPTFNESANVPELMARLRATLAGRDWEVVFVDDDSPDGTANLVRRLAQEDRRIRCVQRLGRRGLSSACIEGMLASSSPVIAVMDADLQHDETLLPAMWDALSDPALDLVVGSRYVSGGSVGAWAASRHRASQWATRLGRLFVPTALHDPMSGFFLMRRRAFESCLPQLSGVGFKLLLDLVASSPRPLKVLEMPFRFRERHAGESKLDEQVVWDYLMLLLDKRVGRWIPVRFLAFAGIGLLGVGVHMGALTVAYRGLGLDFMVAQGVATAVAMVSNYAINNQITYRDRRRRGWRWLTGLLSFTAVCSVGAVANVGVADFLFGRDGRWVPAALAGIVVSAVWNYAASAFFTWGTGGSRPATRQRPEAA